MIKLSTVLAVTLCCLAPQGKDASAVTRKATHALVVHEKNACTETGEAAKALVKKLYLKDMTQWPSGAEAKPYGREAASPAQAAFVQGVLGMSDAELARHWLKLKNMNGTTPPKEVDSVRMLLKHVARHEGAFGVVPLTEAKADGVRTLFEF